MKKRIFNNMRKKKILCSSVIACAVLIATLAFTSMAVADDFDCELDNDSPIVEVIYGEPNIIYEGSPGSFPMIGAGTTVTLIATDPGYPETGSGVSTLWVSTTGPSDLYPINDGDHEDESDEYGVIQVSFTFYEDCWHQIDYRAVDYCDNYLPSEGGFMGEDFYVDATPPTTNTEIVGPNFPIPGTSYSWFGSCTTKWLNVTDDGCQGGAGVEELRIMVYKSSSGSSGPWEEIGNYVISDGGEDGEFADVSDEEGVISVPFHFDEDCWHLIEHWGVDAVGNEEGVSTSQGTKQIHKVDVTHPESSLMVMDRNYCMIEEDICVTTDSTIEMIINNVGTEPCIYPETMGFLRIYVEAEDQWYPNETGEGNYHHYGMDDVEYWKDAYWYRYDEEYKIAFSEECHHIIEFFSKDPLCNTEQTNSIHYYVDDQAPEIVKTVGTPHCGPEWEEFDGIPREDVPYFPDGAWSYCVTTDTEINITTIDHGCCESIVTIEYKIWKDGESEPKSWDTYTGNFTFEDECKHFLLVRAYDCLENGKYDSSYWDLQIFYVDDSAPLIEKTIGDPYCTIVEDEEYCVTTDTPIIIDAGNSGCCPDDDITVRYRFNEGDWINLDEFPETIYFEEECTHVLTIEAWDCLGNTAVDIQTFHVDDSAPELIKTVEDPNCPQSMDCTMLQIPDSIVTMDFFYLGTHAYFDVILSNVPMGYDIINGSYRGWCVNQTHYINNDILYDAELYCSYDPENPLPDDDWDKVNYIINHKHPDATIMDIQEAIWYFVNGGNDPTTAIGQSMVDDAEDHGEGFMPHQGQYCAIVCDSGEEVQKTIIEFKIPENYCVTTETEISLDAIDHPGCCESMITIEYKIWLEGESMPEEWITYTEPFTFEKECTHYLLARTYDCLENGKNEPFWDLEIFYVDDTAPVIHKTVGDPNCTIVEDEEYCVTTDTPIIIDAGNSGCCPDDDITVRYRFNEGDWINLDELPETIYFEEECTHVLTIEAWDCLGNTAVDIQTFHVDDTVPVIHKTIGDPHCTIVEDEEYCVTTDTEIIFDILSSGCCPTDLLIQYNNGSGWIVLTEEGLPFSHYFEEECEHWLNFTVKDCLGRKIYDNQTFYVSDTPPGFNKIVGTPHCGPEWEDVGEIPREYWEFFPEGVESHCVNFSTLITLEPLAHESCCIGDITIEYKTWLATEGEPDEWTTYTEPFSFEEECKHYLLVRAYDCLENGKENISYWDLQIFYVDEQGPNLIKEVGDPKVPLAPDTYGHDQWMIFPETDICFSIDPGFPEDGCCPNETGTIEYRYWYLGEWTDWMLYTDCIHLTEGCVHYLQARAIDCLGNIGPVDNETFWVCGPGGDSGPSITFIEPDFGETSCELTLEVILDASDDKTAKEDLNVILWIPGGRRDAPTLYYYPEYNIDTGYFHAFIDIYKYQDGAELTLQAVVQDEDMNVEMTIPQQFTVCSTIVWDQWMQKGWNSLTLPFGSTSCSSDTEDVLISIDGDYDYVFWYNTQTGLWDWYDYSDKTGFLKKLYTGRQYWVAVNTAGRFFTDTHGPDVEIINPEGGDYEFENTPDYIDIYAFDIETEITEVTVKIYDSTSSLYWNGSDWQPIAAWLDCYHDYDDYWQYNLSGLNWSLGHSYEITAKAMDASGCYEEDMVIVTIGSLCIAIKTYTTDADFNEGTFVGGVFAENDQLQLTPGQGTLYPVMWIANSGESSVSKWDTNENKELARYKTFFYGGGSHTGPAPSRTAVDADGNCYVANRQFPGDKSADVIKILANDFIDRNGNGIMDTSYDANNNGVIEPDEMMPLVDTNGNNKIDPDEIQDERIAWAVEVGPNNGLGRSLAIDLDGNLWVGLFNTKEYYKISSEDGSVIEGPINVAPNTPYGALVDKHGILWGSSLSYNLLRLDTSNNSYTTIQTPDLIYGIALGYDSEDNTLVYMGGRVSSAVVKYDTSTNTMSTPAEVKFEAFGVSTDSQGNIFVGHGSNGKMYKFSPNGSLIWESVAQLASHIRGTVVDSEDNVWAIHLYNNKMCKYDGATGAPLGIFDTGDAPYTYSDATGIGYSGSVVSGKWSAIHDSTAPETIWDVISWNSFEPEGTNITVKIRSSEDQITWSPWEGVANNIPLSLTPPGRYIEIEVTMRINSGETSPILYDITIDGTCSGAPPCLNIVEMAISQNPDEFNTLVQAVVAAGLVDVLSNLSNDFTVFAPTDAAFADLDPSFLQNLLENDTATLIEILTYHVVPGIYMAADLVDGMMLTTVQGSDILISINESVFVNDAVVIIPDIVCCNGVIHGINYVLLPPQNNLPYKPHTPTPADEQTNVTMSEAVISWYGGDPDPGDTVQYYRYFGTDPDNLSFYGFTEEPATELGPFTSNLSIPLLPDTTYYWKIIATDNHGASIAGPLWSFNTISACVEEIHLTKKVWNETSQAWDDFITANQGDVITCNISIYLPEDACATCNGNVTGYIPFGNHSLGFSYVDGSTNITAVFSDGTVEYLDTEPLKVDLPFHYAGLIWNETNMGAPMQLPAGMHLYFTYDVEVKANPADGTYAFGASISATYDCEEEPIEEIDSDVAYVLVIAGGSGLVHNIDSDKWFMTIQEAIDDPQTLDGHTIEVNTSIYVENVIVNKELTIKAASTPVIDGGNETAVSITVDNVVFMGFEIINSTKGIYVEGDYVTLENNHIHGCYSDAIYLSNSKYCTITKNTVLNSSNGIYLLFSDHNIIDENTVNNNLLRGCRLANSINNTVDENIFNNNDIGVSIVSCKAMSKDEGNIIEHNSINGSHFGIYMASSWNNTIQSNYVNDSGLTGFGFYIISSCYHNLFYNNYINNTENRNGLDNGNNTWNISKTPGVNIIGGPYLGGNYWSDYTGEDTNDDGLGEEPYVLQFTVGTGGNQDLYPLVN